MKQDENFPAEYLSELRLQFQKERNTIRAGQQKAYLRDQFDFFGLTHPHRRKIQQVFLDPKYLPEKRFLSGITEQLWLQPEREFQLFGLDLMKKYIKRMELADISLMEFTVVNKSWWDTVDFIASHQMGAYFLKFPEERDERIQSWLDSGNIWLQRCTLIFQLKYREKVDTDLLTHCIEHLTGSKEFFINKAIGWMLRQYGKTNPAWVTEFVDSHPDLAGLSSREALRLIR